MEKIDYAVKKKTDLFNKSLARYIVRCFITGFYFVIAYAAAFLLAEKFLHFDPTGTLTKVTYSLFFGMVLTLIIYTNSELFTSNVMYFTAGLYRKKTKWATALKILVICYVANFVGAVFFSWLFEKSGAWNGIVPTDHNESFMYSAVAGKLAKPPLILFIQGFFANAIVNTAVLMSLRIKDETAKIICIFLAIFIFVAFGQEHVIANFVGFSMALFRFGNETGIFSFASIGTNFLFATLGNIAGGALVIGITYAWLNDVDSIYID